MSSLIILLIWVDLFAVSLFAIISSKLWVLLKQKTKHGFDEIVESFTEINPPLPKFVNAITYTSQIKLRSTIKRATDDYRTAPLYAVQQNNHTIIDLHEVNVA